MEKVRIDKWLWAARFYKTRTLAAEDIHKGRIDINGQQSKPAREVKSGDTVCLRQPGGGTRTLVVKAASDQRGPATQARQLYEETPESQRLRALLQEQRRMGTEPALSLPRGRPGKRDRQAMEDAWGRRWSASLDP